MDSHFAELLPPLSTEEKAALRADIKASGGVKVPIVVDEDGNILDGRHRHEIDVDAPIAVAFERAGLHWAQFIISLGAVAGITSVMLVLMLSQPRVLLAMARDGLLPESFFGAVHPRFRTPWKSTILTGAMVATMASLIPLDVLAELVNIGTLLAFAIVCAAVLVLRKTHPEMARPFRVPFVPFVPVAGIGCCLLLMLSLPWENWMRLGIWLGVGLLIYAGYGRKHSALRKHLAQGG